MNKLDDKLYNISNQENLQNIILKNNMSKNQLEKLKIGIKKRFKNINNSKKMNNNKISSSYSKTHNNFYNPKDINKNNININPINFIHYQNNQINSNYYINNY